MVSAKIVFTVLLKKESHILNGLRVCVNKQQFYLFIYFYFWVSYSFYVREKDSLVQ